MRWEAMAGTGNLVPAERFFVRNRTRTPSIDPATWRLHVHGPGVTRAGIRPAAVDVMARGLDALEVALERGRRTELSAAVELAMAAARSRSA